MTYKATRDGDVQEVVRSDKEAKAHQEPAAKLQEQRAPRVGPEKGRAQVLADQEDSDIA